MSMSRPSLQQQPPLPPPPQPPFPATRSNLELTIISAKHLKNVNWKNGDLKPYVIFWVHPDHKLTTKSDDSGHTKPVWNQRFLLPITSPLSDAFFSLEIFHSKTSETPKPFVGSLQFRLSSLVEPDNPNVIRTFDVLRPSGRPQGKIRLKLAIKEQPLPQPQQQAPPPPPQASSPLEYDYQSTPHPGYYYSSAPPYPYNNSRSASPAPPPPPPPTLQHPTAYPYSMGYYSGGGGYYPTSSGGSRSYGGGAPSAPVDYSQLDQRSRTSGAGFGVGTGLAVGAVAGALGGIALDEGLRYEEAKIAERVEDNYLGTPRDDFSDYRADF